MKLDPAVREKYPDFLAGYLMVSGVTVEQTVEGLVERKRAVFSDLKAKFGGLPITDIPEVKHYRNFFKAMGADPSSYRPAPEYLLRRVLDDRFPAINNVVDSCLLASVEHFISGGVYDVLKMKGEPVTTLATGEEGPFELIDGRKLPPKPDEIILKDAQRIISAYTIGDSKYAKITFETSGVLVVLWNAPGIPRSNMEAAISSLSTYFKKYCGGHVDNMEIL
ncbi:MAG: B3/4 domain-containing protein [Candidatus Hadarchaeales archaeon]